MTRLLALPIAVPLAAAAACALIRRAGPRRAVAFGILASILAYDIFLISITAEGSIPATQVGGWPSPFAIPLAADLFSALMLFVAALMVLVCGAFAAARGEDRSRFFYSLVLVLTAGISGAFLTADIFNLFVFFEVMLVASYVLLSLVGLRDQVRAGAVYVVTSLTGSTLLLAGVALTYGAVGTVNLAELGTLGERAPQMMVPGSLFLVAFALKSSLAPVHGWLPTSYPAASPAVAALFSGLLTKVGIYAMYRVHSVVFQAESEIQTLLLVVASATMLIGVLGALGREDMKQILSFHIVSQVGYMVMGLGLFGTLGLAGGIFYILHHIVVKTSLFLSSGAVETVEGDTALGKIAGVARRQPVVAASFVVAALSLAGLPPFSGFFAKLVLVQAAFGGGEYGVAAVAIVVSFLTLMSMLKIWNGVFADGSLELERAGTVTVRKLVTISGGSGAADDAGVAPRRGRIALVAPGAFLAAVSILAGLGAQGLFVLAQRAAAGLVEPAAYIQAVLGS
ncbi:MAG: monovalent cation/H+ antiporter subunit D family protein [Actinomycetota bacterium]|nr:monovalent cation/H+ antiporter subunit D family protein [Actinomycetota bacterium]